MKIVFMGTAAFAAPTLQRLFEEGYPIATVITQPDKPGGRGQTFQISPVKRKAWELHLGVHQPERLKDDRARSLFHALQPDLIVVVAYGKIIPPWLIELPRHGVVNLHGSLLPKYRGSAPIHWAIANGESETGVCTMRIDEGLDTGPVFFCEKTAIDPNESAGELAERLAHTGADLMKRTIDGIMSGALQPTPQDHSRATVAPILRREDGYIDWTQPARAIHNRIRAFNPWPVAITRFRQTLCKLLKSNPSPHPFPGNSGTDPEFLNFRIRGLSPNYPDPGTIIATKRSLEVVCGDAMLLEVIELQVPNRKPISGKDFVNGMRIHPGEFSFRSQNLCR